MLVSGFVFFFLGFCDVGRAGGWFADDCRSAE